MVAVLLGVAGVLARPAVAQTAHFSGVQTTVASSLGAPDGIAVDGSGNVYIADTTNNRVLKETLSNGVYTQTVLAITGPISRPKA